jgi:hypothetical protein
MQNWSNLHNWPNPSRRLNRHDRYIAYHWHFRSDPLNRRFRFEPSGMSYFLSTQSYPVKLSCQIKISRVLENNEKMPLIVTILTIMVTK